MTVRIGNGYDVHKLVQGRKLILGGVHINFFFGLHGHSDADVLTHAIMDALLGSLALGDIGEHFPDTDDKWRDADSMEMLADVMGMIEKEGYKVGNIDSTIVAQMPKIQPYIHSMRRNIAEVCKVDVSKVSVKATTEEKMGFTGSGDGMKAYAVCTVIKD